MRQCSKCGNQITSNAKLYEAQTVCISCWEKLGGAELYKKHEQVQIAHEQVKTPIVASNSEIPMARLIAVCQKRNRMIPSKPTAAEI